MTEWLCLANGLLSPETRAFKQEGQPRCRAGYTAVKQTHLKFEDWPDGIQPHLPPIDDDNFISPGRTYQKERSIKPLFTEAGNFFYEIGEYKSTSTTGISGTFLVGKPFLAPANVGGLPRGHTAAQIAAISKNQITSGGSASISLKAILG